MTLELEFHEAMIELYRRAKAEIDYPARYLLAPLIRNESSAIEWSRVGRPVRIEDRALVS